MNEEVQFIIDSTKEQMESALHHLEAEFVEECGCEKSVRGLSKNPPCRLFAV